MEALVLRGSVYADVTCDLVPECVVLDDVRPEDRV